MKYFTLFFLVFSLQFSVFKSGVLASFDFPAKYEVTYTYSQSAPTNVHQHITLTNRLSQIYPTSYQLTIVGDPPKNITARDSKGPLKFAIVSEGENSTTIEFKLNAVVAGKGKSQSFDVYYEVGPAIVIADTFEIILPQVKNLDPADSYHLHLYVPTAFGPPLVLTPHPTLVPGTNPNVAHFIYDRSQLIQKEAIATFGLHQLPAQIEFVPPFQIFPPFSTSIGLKLTNPNTTPLSARNLSLSSHNLPLASATLLVPELNPEKSIILTIPLQSWFIPDPRPKSVTVKQDREEFLYNVPDSLFTGWYVTIIITIIIAFTGGGFIAHKAGSLHLQKRKR